MLLTVGDDVAVRVLRMVPPLLSSLCREMVVVFVLESAVCVADVGVIVVVGVAVLMLLSLLVLHSLSLHALLSS